MAASRAPEGSNRGLRWAALAFAGGLALNADRIPTWVALAALAFVIWRLLACLRPLHLPGTLARSALALLLVAGVLVRFHTLNGLVAGTALLALMGSVKLLETRTQRDQFIVIAAGVFLLLSACLDRQSLARAPLYLAQAWLCCVALAVVAYAATNTNTPAAFDNRAAMRLGARTLAFSLPLALLLFLFFPRLPGAFWAIPRSEEALTGLSDTMSPGSISQLTSSYEVAFRAEFTGKSPPPEERYWRGPVLHEFDGYTWSLRMHTLLRTQPLQYLGDGYRYRISLEPSSQRWWFSLDTPTGSPASKVFFTYDYQLIAADPVNEITRYELVSHTETRATGPLPRLARRYETSLDGDRNPRSRAFAAQMRSEAGSDEAFVASVLAFFRTGGFKYTLTPPRLGPDSVDDFVFNTRLGFCGHYASAFVLFMRAAGVPARVVTGYLGGEWNPIGRYFIVHQSDAHAWAEVWFEGRGWTRVDPTAVVEPARLRRGILDILPDAVSAPARFVWSRPWLAAMLQRWDALNTWWTNSVVKFNYDDQLDLLKRLGVRSPRAEQLGWAFGLALVAWMGWMAWSFRSASRRVQLDRLARAYIALCRKLSRVGITREPHQGPLAFAEEIERRRMDLAERLRPLLEHYAQLRFGVTRTESYSQDVRSLEQEIRRLKI